MSLLEQIDADLHSAIKSGNEIVSATLRMLKADISYEKGKTGKDLDDEKVGELLARAAKRRRESIAEFEKADRNDLAEREKAELVVLTAYLPKQMSEADIAAFIDAKIAQSGKPSPSEGGKFMGSIMKELKGMADGAVVKSILAEKLK